MTASTADRSPAAHAELSPRTSGRKVKRTAKAEQADQSPPSPSSKPMRRATTAKGTKVPSSSLLPPPPPSHDSSSVAPPPPPASAPAPSSRSRKAATAAAAAPPILLAPDYTLNPAGPASSSTTSFKCPQKGCEKVYKGKHARSIWRRHLQDKHGIPLSQQPRRTRWDNDANRPKSEEERRARTLDSKRRWARKNRSEREGRAFGEGGGQSVDGEYEDGEDFDWDDESPAPPEQVSAPLPPPPTTTTARGTKSKRQATRRPLKQEESDFEDEDDEPSMTDRYPLVHRDTNLVPGEHRDAQGHSQPTPAQGPRYPYVLQPHPLAPPAHIGSPGSPPTTYYTAPASTNSRGGYAIAGSPQQHPPRREPAFYAGSPTTTSLSTVAGRAALVPSPSYPHAYQQQRHHHFQSRIGEAKEDAAAVLLALKRASSPSSPAASDRNRSADTSLESADASFAFSSRSGASDRDHPSPATDIEDHNDLHERTEDIANLQRRALKRVPILPSLESSLRHRVGDASFGHSTSLVMTPRPAMRMAMESSPAFPELHDDDGDFSEDEVSHSEAGRYGGTSPSGPPARKRLRGLQSSSSQSHAGVSSEVDGFGLTSPRRHRTLSSRARTGEMLPPHPGSSSSASSFNLSTPAGPARDSYGRFFPSSAGAPDLYYPYHQQPHSRPSRAPHGLSSPPGPPSYGMFSSPAHPGVSKQLGLTAQPGPGVLMSAAGQTPGRLGDEERGKVWTEGRLPGVRELDSYAARRGS